MKRKIFEQQTIDLETGEVSKITTVSVSKNNETFGMYRTTTGVEWVLDFQGKELQMMMTLVHFEDIKTRIVALSSLTRKNLLEMFKISKSTFSHLIKAMEDKKYLIRLSPTDILLNPSYFYKGSSSDLTKRISEFYSEYDKKRPFSNLLIDSSLQDVELVHNNTTVGMEHNPNAITTQL
jgi:hypothetical protein